jgi:arginase
MTTRPRVAVVGVPSSAGAYAVGQEEAPAALRAAGLLDALAVSGVVVDDLGDSPVVRWRPDRANPRAQNADTVVAVAAETRDRVADVVRGGAFALVLGGDCTVGVGTLAGIVEAHPNAGLVYVDLHADMNTPESVRDGALDWMGLAHALGLPDTIAGLRDVGSRTPLIDPARLILFGHGEGHATAWERAEIARLGIRRVSDDEVRTDPEAASARALGLLGPDVEAVAVHLDVDVVDFTDAPLSENTGRNTGLALETTLAALRRLLGDPRVVSLSVSELNPAHAGADPGCLERFAAGLAEAVAGVARPA